MNDKKLVLDYGWEEFWETFPTFDLHMEKYDNTRIAEFNRRMSESGYTWPYDTRSWATWSDVVTEEFLTKMDDGLVELAIPRGYVFRENEIRSLSGITVRLTFEKESSLSYCCLVWKHPG